MSIEVAELVATVREMVRAGRTGYKLDVLMAKRQPALVPPKVVLDLLDTLEVCADRLSGIGADLAKMTEERDTMTIAAEAFESRLRDAESALAKMTEERDEAKQDCDLANRLAESKDALVVATEEARQIVVEERHQFLRRAEAAESALVRLKAEGTFAEGIEAAAKVCACRPSSIRALKPNPEARVMCEDQPNSQMGQTASGEKVADASGDWVEKVRRKLTRIAQMHYTSPPERLSMWHAHMVAAEALALIPDPPKPAEEPQP